MYRIDDDEQFVLDFLKQEKVLLVHGRGFNWQEPDHFRIVYLPRVDELAQIQEKMTRFLKQYRRWGLHSKKAGNICLELLTKGERIR